MVNGSTHRELHWLHPVLEGGSSALKTYNGGTRKLGCGSERIRDSQNPLLEVPFLE